MTTRIKAQETAQAIRDRKSGAGGGGGPDTLQFVIPEGWRHSEATVYIGGGGSGLAETDGGVDASIAVTYTRNETTRLLTKRVAAGIDGVIEGGLPPAYDIAKVACKQFPDGVRVYSYAGEDFLELHPLKVDHEMKGGRIMLNATFNYCYLKWL